jgi:hypothetical protein
MGSKKIRENGRQHRNQQQQQQELLQRMNVDVNGWLLI